MTGAPIVMDWARILGDALREDPFYQAIGRFPAGEQGLLDYLAWSIQEGDTWGRVCRPGPDIQGLSVWVTPLGQDEQARKSAEKRRFLADRLGAEAADWYEDVGAFMAANSAPIVPVGAWYLSIAGLATACQGQGRGKHLLTPVLTETDALGVATYLETFVPRNERFYERLGYRKAGSFTCPPIGSAYSLMIRIPK